MAVTRTTTDVKLLVEVETDETKNGKAVTKNLSFSKIKLDATDAELLTAGTAIAALQTHSLSAVNVRDDSTLSESE